MQLKLTVYRYEVIFVLLIFILTGSINIISKETTYSDCQRYPYSVALTFDDGPYPEYTQKLLNILENENVKATFFVVGRHIQKYPELMKLIASKGHEFGGHTYNHTHIKNLPKNKLLYELETTKAIIAAATGKQTYLFRPPGGQYDKKALRNVADYGYTTVLWSILPKDCENYITQENILANVLANTKTNDIILLHMGRQRTLDALPKIICYLRLKGFKFVTISELMKETQHANFSN